MVAADMATATPFEQPLARGEAAVADGLTDCCAPAAHLSSRLATDGCTATTPGTGQLAPRAWPSCRASWRRYGGPPYLVYSCPPQPLLLDTDRGWLSTWGHSKGRATDSNASVRGRGQPLWSSGPRAPGCAGSGRSVERTALNARIGGGEAGGLALRRNCTGSYSAAAVATTWPSTATLPEGPVGSRRRQGPPLPGMVCAAPATASGCWRLASLGGIQAAARAVVLAQGPSPGPTALQHERSTAFSACCCGARRGLRRQVGKRVCWGWRRRPSFARPARCETGLATEAAMHLAAM